MLTACSSSQSASGSYFKASGIDMGATAVWPWRVVSYPADLVSSQPGRIRLLSAQLIPVPGFRLPRLARLGVVVDGCGVAVPAFAFGWPPLIRTGDRNPVRVSPFEGTWLTPGTRTRKQPGPGHRSLDCFSFAVYGVTASSPGYYATGGLRITFMSGSQRMVSSVFNGGFAYYPPPHPVKGQEKTYERLSNAAFQALDNLAHSQQ